MKSSVIYWFSIALVPFLGSFAFSDIIITGRSSQHRFDYVYGFGGDTVSGNENNLRSDLLAADSFVTHFQAGNSGFYPPLNSGWNSSVDILLNHQYQTTGAFPGSVTQIGASGEARIVASNSGIGDALAQATNPGNELLLYFTVASEQAFEINGEIASSFVGPGDQGHAYVLLQKFDSFAGWGFGGFYSIFLPDGGLGSWAASGVMTPGDYRLVSGAYDRATGNQSFTNSYSYTFTAVPEPSSLGLSIFLMLASYSALVRRDRQS